MEQSKKEGKILSFPLLSAGLIFLCNPNINLFDILPDAVGWFLLAAAITGFSDIQPYFDRARKHFIWLGWISVGKIAALFLALYVLSISPDDRAIISVLCLTFAALELIFAIPALQELWRGFLYIGERDGISEAFTGIQHLPVITLAFLLVKHIGAFLPELSLASVAYLDQGYSDHIIRAYPIFLLFALLLGLGMGLYWLYTARQYLMPLAQSTNFSAFMQEKAQTNRRFLHSHAIYRQEGRLLWVLFAAILCGVDILLNQHNYLPDLLSGILLLLFFLMARKDRAANMPSGKKACCTGIAFSALYTIATTCTTIFTEIFLSQYDYPDVAYRPAAATLYTAVEICAILEALLLLGTLASLFLFLRQFGKTHSGLVGIDGQLLHDPQTEKELQKKDLRMLILGIATALFHLIEVFLLTVTERHIISSSEANEYYHAGQALYYPRFEGSYLVTLVLSVAWVVSCWLLIDSLREEMAIRYLEFADGEEKRAENDQTKGNGIQ